MHTLTQRPATRHQNNTTRCHALAAEAREELLEHGVAGSHVLGRQPPELELCCRSKGKDCVGVCFGGSVGFDGWGMEGWMDGHMPVHPQQQRQRQKHKGKQGDARTWVGLEELEDEALEGEAGVDGHELQARVEGVALHVVGHLGVGRCKRDRSGGRRLVGCGFWFVCMPCLPCLPTCCSMMHSLPRCLACSMAPFMRKRPSFLSHLNVRTVRCCVVKFGVGTWEGMKRGQSHTVTQRL